MRQKITISVPKRVKFRDLFERSERRVIDVINPAAQEIRMLALYEPAQPKGRANP